MAVAEHEGAAHGADAGQGRGAERGSGHGYGQGHGHGGGQGEGHGHGHGHSHGHADIDWAVMAPVLEQNAEVTAPVYREVAAWLRDLREVREGGRSGVDGRPGADGRPAVDGRADGSPADGDPSLIVDAGSGPGVVTCLFAEVFPQAQVIAADPEEALLERTVERAARLGLADRVRTHRAELPDGLGELPPADLIWAARSVHHVGDQVAALTALADRLAPGGTLAILEGGLAPRSLPRDFGIGRPGLQARLDAANEEWFARMRADLPGAKEATEDWAALLTAAGLRHVATRSFLVDLPAPLDDGARDHIVTTFGRYRDLAADTENPILAPEDRATLDRLLDPQDPESLHRRADLFLLTAHTVHVAVREA